VQSSGGRKANLADLFLVDKKTVLASKRKSLGDLPTYKQNLNVKLPFNCNFSSTGKFSGRYK